MDLNVSDLSHFNLNHEHILYLIKTINQWKKEYPAWIPEPEIVSNSHIAQAIRQFGFEDYSSLYQWSITDRESYWRYAIEKLGILFRKQPSVIFDSSQTSEAMGYLPGAQLNIAQSCFQADPNKIAIIYREKQTIKH